MGLMAYFVMSRASSFTTSSQAPRDEKPAAAVPEILYAKAPPDGRDFFAEARLARNQDRSLRKHELTALIDNPNIDADNRKSAAEELRTVMKYTSLEAQAEALIRSRGIDDVLVHLTDNTALVTIRAKDPSKQQAVQVADAVAAVTGLKLSAVKVRFQE